MSEEPETGPVYEQVPLIDVLPIPGSAMRQAMPSRADLQSIIGETRPVAGERISAGYEVLLCHYHNQREEIRNYEAMKEGVQIRIAELEALTEEVERLKNQLSDRKCAKCRGTGQEFTHTSGYFDCRACNGKGF